MKIVMHKCHTFSLITAILLCLAPSMAPAGNSAKEIQIATTESKWVIFREIIPETGEDTIVLSGTFLMKAERMYGHFEAVGYDKEGNALSRAKTDDRPYSRDHGPTIKNLALILKPWPENAVKIVVSFYETRKKEGY